MDIKDLTTEEHGCLCRAVLEYVYLMQQAKQRNIFPSEKVQELVNNDSETLKSLLRKLEL